jgi:hypothetical protein
MSSLLAGSLGALLASGLLAIVPAAALAQYSPNCLKNGRKAYCALTIEAESAKGSGAITVVFADHSAYRLVRDDASCRQQGTVNTCRATISPGNGQQPAQAATYVGTWYEGGYRHEYRSRSVAITYFFLD